MVFWGDLDLEDMLRMVSFGSLHIFLKVDELIFAEKTFACMKQAYDCGINFFDTAER